MTVEEKNSDEEIEKRIEVLIARTMRLGEALNLPKDFLATIFRAENDWTFCIALASFIEAILNELLVRGLKFESGAISVPGSKFANVIERLPMLGRTGRLTLARNTGMPEEFANYVEGIFLLRNMYAHSFGNIGRSLNDIVQNHSEKKKLMKWFSIIKDDTDGAVFTSWVDAEPSLLRFSLFDSMLKLATLIHAVGKWN